MNQFICQADLPNSITGWGQTEKDISHFQLLLLALHLRGTLCSHGFTALFPLWRLLLQKTFICRRRTHSRNYVFNAVANMTALSPKPEPAFYRHCTVFVETGQKGFLERPDLQQNQENPGLLQPSLCYDVICTHVGYSSAGDTQHKELAMANMVRERLETVIYRRNPTELTIKMINAEQIWIALVQGYTVETKASLPWMVIAQHSSWAAEVCVSPELWQPQAVLGLQLIEECWCWTVHPMGKSHTFCLYQSQTTRKYLWSHSEELRCC